MNRIRENTNKKKHKVIELKRIGEVIVLISEEQLVLSSQIS